MFGPLIYFFAREAKGHGVPEVMLAVAQKGGRIRPIVAVVKVGVWQVRPRWSPPKAGQFQICSPSCRKKTCLTILKREVHGS